MISQREARKLKRRVEQLERMENERRRAWSGDWPGGVHVGTITVNPSEWATIKTARRLGHAVVAMHVDGQQVRLYALPLPTTT